MLRPRFAFVVVLLSAAACAGRGGAPPDVPGPGPDAHASDPDTIVARARESANRFVRFWRFAWESSEGLQHGRDSTWKPRDSLPPFRFTAAESAAARARYDRLVPAVQFRGMLLHCHPDPPPPVPRFDPNAAAAAGISLGGRGQPPTVIRPSSAASVSDAFVRVDPYIIEASGRHAICPSWHPTMAVPWDERTSLDVMLVPFIRDSVRRSRARLLATLEDAARRVPRDGWLAGQRVRFAFDQGDTARAVRAVAECVAQPWWCRLLEGYVGAVRRRPFGEVDSVFAAALAAMDNETHCEWNDLLALLDDDGRRAYRRLTCAGRDSVNERIWWLSDPTFTEPANDRRVEHHARRVMVVLRSGTDLHERWDFRRSTSGDAVREMLVRYGWPSFAWWGGSGSDRGHHNYLSSDDAGRDHGRFTTQEYSAPRFHTVPAWSAVADPWTTLGFEWAVSLRAGEYITPTDTLWWPREHYQRLAGPMVQLWHQVGLFRRDTTAMLAMGSDLSPHLFDHAIGDTLKGALVFSTGPDSMRFEPRGGIVGYGAVFRAAVESRPQLVSLELHGQHPPGVVARDRYGIRPPPPLSVMRPGQIDVSEPVLIRPLNPGEVLPNDPDAALRRMFGTTVLRAPSRVGLYWESYGIAAGDTVDVSVRLERREVPPGTLRRIGFRLGIGQRTDGGFTAAWREPDPARVVTSVPGRIPVQGRSITVDISAIPAGDYAFVVTMTRAGATVSATRELWISR